MITTTPDGKLVDALKNGDEDAFKLLIDTYGSSLMRVARAHVGSRARPA